MIFTPLEITVFVIIVGGLRGFNIVGMAAAHAQQVQLSMKCLKAGLLLMPLLLLWAAISVAHANGRSFLSLLFDQI